jgi:hypothetical protein
MTKIPANLSIIFGLPDERIAVVTLIFFNHRF